MEQENVYSYKPIGHIKSIFPTKNGTPRQSGLSEFARASLRISKEVFTNPDHSLQNLAEFSHVWLLWVFHLDTDNTGVKAKVTPPRLGGERVGVFSTRQRPFLGLSNPHPLSQTLAPQARQARPSGEILNYVLAESLVLCPPKNGPWHQVTSQTCQHWFDPGQG